MAEYKASMADITKLRNITSAGLMDCKKALSETEGDIDAAVEILRKKGKAVAAKRADRQASEGCVLAKKNGNYAAIVALCCETDFVAKNAGFVALANQLIDLAVENKVKTVEELKALTIDGRTVEDLIVEEGGKTGEKTEIGYFECLEAQATAAYTHFNSKLATIVGFNMEASEEVGHNVAMQVASMNPVAVNRDAVDPAIIESERAVAIEKTKDEQIKKAVEAALKKAGLNPNLLDSEDHIASNIAKGWLTEEDAEKGRAVAKEAAEKKAANMPQQMIDNIVAGRINKYYKEYTLMEQEFVMDGSLTVGEYLEKSQAGLVAVAFKRVNLNQD